MQLFNSDVFNVRVVLMLYPLDGDVLCCGCASGFCHIKETILLSTWFSESHFCFNFSGATAVEIPLPNFKMVSKTVVNWFYRGKCAS